MSGYYIFPSDTISEIINDVLAEVPVSARKYYDILKTAIDLDKPIVTKIRLFDPYDYSRASVINASISVSHDSWFTRYSGGVGFVVTLYSGQPRLYALAFDFTTDEVSIRIS